MELAGIKDKADYLGGLLSGWTPVLSAPETIVFQSPWILAAAEEIAEAQMNDDRSYVGKIERLLERNAAEIAAIIARHAKGGE